MLWEVLSPFLEVLGHIWDFPKGDQLHTTPACPKYTGLGGFFGGRAEAAMMGMRWGDPTARGRMIPGAKGSAAALLHTSLHHPLEKHCF